MVFPTPSLLVTTTTVAIPDLPQLSLTMMTPSHNVSTRAYQQAYLLLSIDFLFTPASPKDLEEEDSSPK